MNDDDISKLVKLANSLVYEKTGTNLENVEEAILRQTLTGKKNTAIQFKGFTGSYVQRLLAPKLWKLLSEATGEKVHKRNVLRVLEKLQSQPMQSGVASRGKYLAKAQAKSNSRVVFESFILHTELTDAQNIFNSPDSTLHDSTPSSTRVNYCINPDCTNRHKPIHHYYCMECGTPLPVNDRLHKPLQAEQAEGKESGNSSTNSTEGEPQPFSQAPHSNKAEPERDSSTYSLAPLFDFFKFMKPGGPLLLSIGVCGSLFGLSWLANWYGAKNHVAGQLPLAQLAYRISLKLNPWSTEAHYNQGSAYEDEQNYQQAHQEYQKAIEGGLVPAYNNQARLYILEGKYDAAVGLLQVGLPLVKNEDERVRYSFLKNRGWARLEQDRLEEAKLDLTEAIKLQSQSAPAYCLMAQVLERQGEQKNALAQWENCLGFSYQPQTPEEDKWLETASQRLSVKGGKQ